MLIQWRFLNNWSIIIKNKHTKQKFQSLPSHFSGMQFRKCNNQSWIWQLQKLEDFKLNWLLYLNYSTKSLKRKCWKPMYRKKPPNNCCLPISTTSGGRSDLWTNLSFTTQIWGKIIWFGVNEQTDKHLETNKRRDEQPNEWPSKQTN